MRVVVDEFDFENSSDEISSFYEKASYTNNEILKCCSDSERHIKTNSNKIDSKISNWKEKIKKLNDLKNKLTNEINQHKKDIESATKKAEKILKDTLKCNDESKISSLKNEHKSCEHKIDEANNKIKQKTEKLALVEEDIRVATEYLEKLKVMKEKNDSAKQDLEVTRQYVNNSISILATQANHCLVAISEMSRHIEEFNSFSYSSSSQYGNAPHLSVPSLHSSGKLSKRPASTPTVTRSVASPIKLTIPTKLRLISEDGPIIEIIGPYNDKVELGEDLTCVKKIYPSKCTVCIKKPITVPTPCFANIKELADYVLLFEFKSKMTLMGTRYTDGDGKIYFNYSGV